MILSLLRSTLKIIFQILFLPRYSFFFLGDFTLSLTCLVLKLSIFLLVLVKSGLKLTLECLSLVLKSADFSKEQLKLVDGFRALQHQLENLFGPFFFLLCAKRLDQFLALVVLSDLRHSVLVVGFFIDRIFFLMILSSHTLSVVFRVVERHISEASLLICLGRDPVEATLGIGSGKVLRVKRDRVPALVFEV